MNKEKEPVFNDPIEWRLELYSQNTSSIINTYKQNETENQVGLFLLDLNDPIANKLANSLIKDLNTNENTLTLLVHIDTFMEYIKVLSAQKSNGFQIDGLIYKEETEVPVCVVAANGATFFAVQNLK
jgi:hypothetical protein